MKRVLAATAIAAAAIAATLVIRGRVAGDPLDVLTAGDGARTGSWFFPRGGPYVLGFQCQSACELKVDGRTVARGEASDKPVKRRRVYEAGVYAVSFVGEGRLLWHPPGRRGPLEYVPASSLSPDPPERARFDDPGTSIGDGIAALVILAVLLGWVAALLWPWIGLVERLVWIEMAAVFALALGMRLWGLGDAGATWDEDVNWSAGRNDVTNIVAADGAERSWIWNFEHPPVMKMVVGVGAQLADGYGPARALSAIAMALACAFLVPIGRRLSHNRGAPGLWAGVLAALTPHLIGHGQIVGHESFAALWWSLAILAALRIEHAGIVRFEVETVLVAAGVCCGLAIFSRFASGLVGPLVYAIVVIKAPAHLRWKVAWKAALILPVAALAVGFAVWPRLWSSPIAHTLEAWEVLSKPHGAEPFLGDFTNKPPLYYFAVYLVATAPLGLLAAAAVGVFRAIERRDSTSLVLGLWLVIPLAVMFSPVRQDGVRYIIPSLLAVAMLGGFGLERAGELVARIARQPAYVVTRALFAALAIYMLVACLLVKPYYIDYYGEQVGGPAGVAEGRSFEMGWWGEGLHRAIDYVNSHAEPGDRVHKRCVEPSHLTWLRADLWKTEARTIAGADWVVVYSPVGRGRKCRIDRGLTLVFEESVRGAPLARVYRRQTAEAPN